MSLRIAYASALRFLRKRNEVSQQQLAPAANPSYVSRLESGTRSVTLDVSQELAQALKVDPLTLLVLAYAAERDQTPEQVMSHLLEDLSAQDLLASKIASGITKDPHPEVIAGMELHSQIIELMDQGLTQAEVARKLGVARQTVSNHLKRK
ncbi:helix-turn-helix domain-containing protein [Pseudomonas atacamensis]|uniref:Helix-turn-helix domain-containing protein n=1 Tax=Pseudomonas atacamensis TaxID=2565368 RepID=A0AAQ2I2A7_9PSED|nr:helix-turn-helix domain-containing protein [Pseudomonas atacamensis]THF34435.1 helix-turn-helix domain-containing protein [Pseudomonas atacamensis]